MISFHPTRCSFDKAHVFLNPFFQVTKLPKSTTVFEFDLAALNPAQDGGDSDPS